VKKHDAGTYLCRASNGIGRQQTKVISVEVLGKCLTDWNYVKLKRFTIVEALERSFLTHVHIHSFMYVEREFRPSVRPSHWDYSVTRKLIYHISSCRIGRTDGRTGANAAAILTRPQNSVSDDGRAVDRKWRLARTIDRYPHYLSHFSRNRRVAMVS